MTAVPAVTTAATLGTVCTNQKPFKISVRTDSLEQLNFDGDAAANAANTETNIANGVSNNAGFSLSKYQLGSFFFCFL